MALVWLVWTNHVDCDKHFTQFSKILSLLVSMQFLSVHCSTWLPWWLVHGREYDASTQCHALQPNHLWGYFENKSYCLSDSVQFTIHLFITSSIQGLWFLSNTFHCRNFQSFFAHKFTNWKLPCRSYIRGQALHTYSRRLWWADSGWTLGARQSCIITPSSQLYKVKKIQWKVHDIRLR